MKRILSSIKNDFHNGFRSTSNWALICIVAVLIVFNIVYSVAERKFSLGIDVSEEKIYTLTNQTEQLLGELNEDIYIYTFYSPGKEDPIIAEILQRYSVSSPHIKLKNLSASSDRRLVEQFSTNNALSESSIVVSTGDALSYRVISGSELYETDDRFQAVAIRAESRISTAIQRVSTGIAMRVCLLTGHNETDASSLGSFIQSLDKLGYEVTTYNSHQASNALNPQTDLLFVISPKLDLNEAEASRISDFLAGGGRAVFMMDNASFLKKQGVLQLYPDRLPYFESIFSQYGLSLNKDLIVGGDASYISLRATTLVLNAADHPITDNTNEKKQPIVFSDSSSISAVPQEGVAVTPLLSTEPTCYSKAVTRNLRNLKQEESDPTGRFVVGALAEKGDSKLLLFSSSSFISNENLGISGNSALLTQALPYITPGDMGMQFKSKLLSGFALPDLPSYVQPLISILGLFLLPASILVTGLWIWYRRKKRHILS